MEFATPVVTPVVETLMRVLKRHLAFYFSSTNNVRDMHAKIQQLNATAHDMKEKKERNDANNLEVPHCVPAWLEKVEAIRVKARNIPAVAIGCFNIKTRYKAGKRSSDIIQEIGVLKDEQSKITWTDEQMPLGKVCSTRSSTSEPVPVVDDDDSIRNRIVSRDLIFNEALKSLDPNNKIQMIALCGMGGVGKTTMMEELKKVAEKRKMFDWVAKVAFGKGTNPSTIQQTIAEYMGQPLTETQKDTRAERLRKRFEGMSKDGKKILVILDDLWEELDLKDIGLTSPLPNGFKLLLTSRDEKVCTRMGVETDCIFKIAVLQAAEAKLLFWKIARSRASDGDIDHALHNIGEDIVQKCGGLPIAIKTIASILRDVNFMDVWKDTMKRVQNKELLKPDTIFEISYNNLNDADEKAIFLLSGLFPDDYNISVEDLTRYGWGLKLFTNLESISDARHRVNACIHNLTRSNLLIESDRKGCVKMHDLVRDFVLSNFSGVKQASLVNSDDISKQLTKELYERILLKCTGMSEFPADFNHPNLVLLKLMDEGKLRKFPEDFYNRMEKLEVVAYEKIHQPLLPRCSTTLRTLCLDSCSSVDDISFIGDLSNLEVLSFANCGISKLPSTIGKLIKLKLLDLTGCVDLSIDDGVFQKLINLTELYMEVYDKTIRFTEDTRKGLEMLSSELIVLELEFFKNILQPKHFSFKKLERFRISIGRQLTRTYLNKNEDEDDLSSFENTLKMVATSKELLECKINELFVNTEKLVLSVKEMNYLEDISMQISQYCFCNLRVLHVYECPELRSIFMVNVASSLKKLESLTVCACPVLGSLVQAENSGDKPINFPKLKVLKLKRLPMLVRLCDIGIVMELPQLVELIVEDLPNFTSIFSEYKSISAAPQPLLNTEVVIPKLESLEIYDMENLKEIWASDNTTGSEVEVNNNISTLRAILVLRCVSLVNLFPIKNPMRLLTHLERLDVRGCPCIEELFNIDVGCIGEIENVSTSLRAIRVTYSDNLRSVWRITGDENNSGLLLRGFQGVQSIEVSTCYKFRSIITPTAINFDFDMGALTYIRIYDCGGRSESVTDRQNQQQVPSSRLTAQAGISSSSQHTYN